MLGLPKAETSGLCLGPGLETCAIAKLQAGLLHWLYIACALYALYMHWW